jgi:hypothetical protein
MTSDRCYAGNIFIIALPFIFIPRSNSGMAKHAAQYKKTKDYGTGSKCFHKRFLLFIVRKIYTEKSSV